MYTTVFPSVDASASDLASVRSGAKRCREVESVVSVRVSQGVPEWRSMSFESLSRFTYIPVSVDDGLAWYEKQDTDAPGTKPLCT